MRASRSECACERKRVRETEGADDALPVASNCERESERPCQRERESVSERMRESESERVRVCDRPCLLG